MFEYLNEDQIITGIKRKEILYEKISNKYKKNIQIAKEAIEINPENINYVPGDVIKANFDFFMKFIINYETKEVFQIVNSIVDNFKIPKEIALKVYNEYLKTKEASSVSKNLQYLMLKMIPYIPKKKRTKEMLLIALGDSEFIFDYEDFPQCILEEMTIEDIKYLSEKDALNANKYISTYKHHCDVKTVNEIKELAQIAIEAIKLQKSKVFIKNIYYQVFFNSYGDRHDFMIDYKIPTNITANKALVFLYDFVEGRVQPEVNSKK